MSKQNSTKDIQFTLRVSPELWDHIRQVLPKTAHKNVSEFIRACIRAYIDESADIMGSRRHFQNRLGERMDRLEALILWNALLGQMITARNAFTIMDELTPEDATEQPPQVEDQFAQSFDMSRKMLSAFLAQQQPIIDKLEEHQRKQRKDKHAQTDKG
jgi:Arc/MetJ-type ribon-helix-helix transcriptional regulator